MTKFDYLLSAFEQASQSAEPAKYGYAKKRQALFDYVRDLEAKQTRVPDGWNIRFQAGGYIVIAPDGRGAYAAQPDFTNIAATVLYELAKDLLAAAPTPEVKP